MRAYQRARPIDDLRLVARHCSRAENLTKLVGRGFLEDSGNVVPDVRESIPNHSLNGDHNAWATGPPLS